MGRGGGLKVEEKKVQSKSQMTFAYLTIHETHLHAKFAYDSSHSIVTMGFDGLQTHTVRHIQSH